MIWITIYLIGVVLMLTILCFSARSEDVTLGDTTIMLLLSLLSWSMIILFIVFFMEDMINEVRNSNKVIYHGKKNKEDIL